MADKSSSSSSISSDFKRIIIDMMRDLTQTFPELKNNMNEHILSIINGDDEKNEHIGVVIEHCRAIFPERFFDILYQNSDIFSSFPKLELLPGIDFCILWKENITDNTRNILWKYLQLILFTIVSDINNGDSFGDTSKLFQAINEDDFKKKLEDTVNQMHSLFVDISGASGTASASASGSGSGSGEGGDGVEKENEELPIPDPKEFHDHITGMMDGKLGSLAKEIAEKVAGEMKVDMADSKSMDDIFQKLLKNPTKLMSLVKSVGSTLDEKLKSGDLKESELLQEAMEMMKKMKKMPGMSQMQSMFSKMGIDINGLGGGLGKGGAKVNMGAMKAQLEKNIKIQKQKEEIQRKLKIAADLKAATAAAAASGTARSGPTAEQLRKTEDKAYKELMRSCGINENGKENLVFSTGEKYSKSEKDGNIKKKNKKKNKK
jgi:hypothetical protein